MALTFEKIASVAVTSGTASSLDFTSIPGTYTDLCIKTSVRSVRTGGHADFIIRFNSSSSTYTNRRLYGNASGIGTDTSEHTNTNSDIASSSVFGPADIYIYNYTDSNTKSWIIDQFMENNAQESYCTIGGGMWSGTSAITSISISDVTGNNWKQYSMATLYGIKKS